MLLGYLAIVLIIAGCHCAGENPVVETPLGAVLGYLGTSYNGKTYLAFEGIPYAKPPIGEKRFEEPEPIDPWDGIWNATAVTSCVQVFPSVPGYYLGEEDCLHINVYVPREEINPDEKLEVVVHIHGGGYYSGSGNLYSKPTFATDKDIIFITFNYRLTLFGFLSTEDDVVPGNNGLKDQVLALKWIKNNIESFGGNPDSITVTGLSAGSGSLHLHYLSEQSKGLFHRGFAQSGMAFNPWDITEGNLDKARQLADSVDCPTDTTRKLIDCLKEVPYETLAAQIQQFHENKFAQGLSFGPVVEKGGSNPFIADHPYNLLVSGKVQDLPLIVSNALHEGLVAVSSMSDEDYTFVDQNWNDLAPLLFDYNYTLSEESWLSTAEKIREHYLGDEDVTPENYLKLTHALTDRFFACGDEIGARLQANVTTSPVYYYIFAYPGDNNPAQTVPHGAEITYMYGNTDPSVSLTENELEMKDLLWDMVVTYAKTGVPSFYEDLKWQPTTYQETIYLYLSGVEREDIQALTAAEISEIDFWRSLNLAENENLINNYNN